MRFAIQVESRKLKFVYEDSLLVAQGASMEVNRVNKERYCNLVARKALSLHFKFAGLFLLGSSRVICE